MPTPAKPIRTCADCRAYLPHQRGKGRPFVRCADCQQRRRRAQFRRNSATYRERKAGS